MPESALYIPAGVSAERFIRNEKKKKEKKPRKQGKNTTALKHETPLKPNGQIRRL